MISYLAALLAVVTNAASNVLNRKAAMQAPGRARFRLQLTADRRGAADDSGVRHR